MCYQLLWGDLHNHNSVGLFHYSKGSLPRTIEIAKSHLDFFAFTGHASWHDMPTMPNDGHLKWQEGFDYHTEEWPKTQRLMADANREGEFVSILGYEWHSAKFGDRCVLCPSNEAELFLPDHIHDLSEHAMRTGALLYPHHLGYESGLPGRGVNWDSIDETVSPVIEIYSEHGGAERDRGPWPYVRHTNGPRTTFNTLQRGLALGKRVGVVAGTDDHFGCPGAYGEGLAGVYAKTKTREAVFDALRARRTYAVTGDRIDLHFTVNDRMMGSILPWTSKCRIEVSVRGWDDLAMVEVVKNNQVLYRHFVEDSAHLSDPFSGLVKCRIEFGWGPWSALGIPRTANWAIGAEISDGRFRNYMPCFQSGPFDEDRRNRVVAFGETICQWESYTSRSGCFAEMPTNAVVLEAEGDSDTTLNLTVSSPHPIEMTLPLGDLARSSAIEFLDRFPCESLLVHRLVPESLYATSFSLDDAPSASDFYYVRVTQSNGQMAWSSPIWIGEETK